MKSISLLHFLKPFPPRPSPLFSLRYRSVSPRSLLQESVHLPRPAHHLSSSPCGWLRALAPFDEVVTFLFPETNLSFFLRTRCPDASCAFSFPCQFCEASCCFLEDLTAVFLGPPAILNHLSWPHHPPQSLPIPLFESQRLFTENTFFSSVSRRFFSVSLGAYFSCPQVFF